PIKSELFVPMEEIDHTAITDSHGKNLVTPGWIGRWVRLTDVSPNGDRKPTLIPMRNYQRWGGRVIMDPDRGGKFPKMDIYGIAMEIPRERYGARVIAKSERATFDDDEVMRHLDDYAEEINSQAGRRGGLVSVSSAEGDGNRSL